MTRRKSRYYPEVAEAIARNYGRLRALCWHPDTDSLGAVSYDDIFQDTVMLMMSDDRAAACKTDEELLSWFQYRYNMIQFRAIQEYKQSRMIYANYHKTEEAEEER